MYGRDPWGGPLEINAADSATDDDRSRNLQEFDKAALSRPLDETQQSWLLGPGEQKKKKYVDLGCIIVSRKLFVWTVGTILAAGFLVGFITLIVKTVPRHHHSHSPPDNYTIALGKALMFFNAQKSGKLPKHNNGERDVSGGDEAAGGGGEVDDGSEVVLVKSRLKAVVLKGVQSKMVPGTQPPSPIVFASEKLLVAATTVVQSKKVTKSHQIQPYKSIVAAVNILKPGLLLVGNMMVTNTELNSKFEASSKDYKATKEDAAMLKEDFAIIKEDVATIKSDMRTIKTTLNGLKASMEMLLAAVLEKTNIQEQEDDSVKDFEETMKEQDEHAANIEDIEDKKAKINLLTKESMKDHHDQCFKAKEAKENDKNATELSTFHKKNEVHIEFIIPDKFDDKFDVVNGVMTILNFLIFSSAVDIMTKTQFITGSQTIVSIDGSFEMGFFSPGNSQNQYLGIWYKKISSRTVVWVANREIPLIVSSGVLKVIDPGILALLNGTSCVIWSANVTRSTVKDPIGQLLESGNLVVRDANDDNPEHFLWQSFDHPCDTLIPGMKLGKNFVSGLERHLSSWKSSDDPGQGDFAFRCDPQGYPQLILSNGSIELYRTGPWNGLGFSGRPNLKPNSIYTYGLVFTKEEVFYGYELINNSVVSRFSLSHNGIMQRLTWIDRTQEWVLYLTTPTDNCDYYKRCGPYGSCNIESIPVCGCLSNFVPKYPKEWENGDWSDGCVRRTPLDCHNGDGFLKFSHYKMPDTRYSWFNKSMTLTECKMDSTVQQVGFSGKKKEIVGVILALLFRLLLLGISITLYLRKKKKNLQLNREGNLMHNSEQGYNDKSQKEDLELPLFDLAVIANSTNNFSIDNKLGEGGFGPVYKEWENGDWSDGCVRRTPLDCHNGDGFLKFSHYKMPDTRYSWFNKSMTLTECKMVCLKNCSCTAYTNLDIRGGGSGCLLWFDELIDMREFNENGQDIYIRMASSKLGNLMHNSEQGYNDKSQKEDLELPLFDLAVIANSTNNFSIDNKLGEGGFGPVYKGILKGGQEIAVKRLSKNSSQGLNEFKNEVICIAKLQHRNLVKLLGCCIQGEEKMLIYEYMPNKSLDFFIFAFLCSGYIAPEYAVDGLFSVKSDVFSFGVLVLEIVSGKRNRGFYHPSHRLNLLGHVWRLYKEEDRPSMSSVVLMLDSEGALPQVKQPGFFTERNVHEAGCSSSKNATVSANEITITLLNAR
ncbi:hypothetical protein TEA_004957 [Camellia sinensis var. sinensis]|uniref:non-specific serine/threonine protein kinase n=1 Tax=Camellia sinensis var. sinensis TaxID=542762 RepID=A0A4S4ELR8_CAMSN|nr:hypothetical protein TEA_004957 [Camellia sinensis var. sinensis]